MLHGRRSVSMKDNPETPCAWDGNCQLRRLLARRPEIWRFAASLLFERLTDRKLPTCKRVTARSVSSPNASEAFACPAKADV